jgi:hypothetical protein
MDPLSGFLVTEEAGKRLRLRYSLELFSIAAKSLFYPVSYSLPKIAKMDAIRSTGLPPFRKKNVMEIPCRREKAAFVAYARGGTCLTHDHEHNKDLRASRMPEGVTIKVSFYW